MLAELIDAPSRMREAGSRKVFKRPLTMEGSVMNVLRQTARYSKNNPRR
jgi:hypothetical protein